MEEGTRTVRLLRGTFSPWPSSDLAVTRALLLQVAARAEPETMRLYRPPATVMVGRQDRLKAGYPTASLAARSAGFVVADRLAGVRSLAVHEGTVVTVHVRSDPEPQRSMPDRYVESATAVATALRTLGVDARIGEVPGEYAPGAYSVNARDQAKLATVTHHAVSGASMVWTAITVTDAERLRDVLVEVNEALEFAWEPRRLGSVEEQVAGVSPDDVIDALLAAWRARAELSDGEMAERTLNLARALEPEHRGRDRGKPPDTGGPAAADFRSGSRDPRGH